MKTPEKHIGEVLAHNQDDNLAKLLHEARQLSSLNRTVLSLLEPELAAHCKVSKFSNGCLVIDVDSSSWALQLRYQTPELRGLLRGQANCPSLASIKCRVQPINNEENTCAHPVASQHTAALPKEAAQQLLAIAKHIDNVTLQSALEKLAENAS